MRRALATLDVFDHFCRAAGLRGGDSVDALATSAIRDAENADGFLALAREHTGLPIRVLSREEEARYGYLAAVNSTTLTDGCVLDLGGGSLQLVRVVDRRRARARLVASGRGAHDRAVSARERARQAQADRQLREHVAPSWRTRRLARRAGSRLVGIGGTVRNLAVAVQRASGLPSNGVQATIVSSGALDELVQRLAALPASRAQLRARHQAGARRPDPRRRDRRAGRAARGRLRQPGSHRGGTARGRLLRAAARADARLDRPAAVRRPAPHERAEPGRAVPS